MILLSCFRNVFRLLLGCVRDSFSKFSRTLLRRLYPKCAVLLFCLPWVVWPRCRLSFQNHRFVAAVMRTDVTSNTSRASAYPMRAQHRMSSAYGVKCARHTIACNWRYDHDARFRLCCVQVSSEYFGNSRHRSRIFFRLCYLCVRLTQTDVPFPIPYSAIL